MTLREQLRQIGTRVINEAWANSVGISRLIDALIVKAFIEDWPGGNDTRALRRAYELLDKTFVIADDEPAVRVAMPGDQYRFEYPDEPQYNRTLTVEGASGDGPDCLVFFTDGTHSRQKYLTDAMRVTKS
jgi:hypothetical protein